MKMPRLSISATCGVFPTLCRKAGLRGWRGAAAYKSARSECQTPSHSIGPASGHWQRAEDLVAVDDHKAIGLVCHKQRNLQIVIVVLDLDLADADAGKS